VPVTKIHFDERIAENYDADSTDMFEPTVIDATVDFLESRAGGGSVLGWPSEPDG
jgi:hypothetical protein